MRFVIANRYLSSFFLRNHFRNRNRTCLCFRLVGNDGNLTCSRFRLANRDGVIVRNLFNLTLVRSIRNFFRYQIGHPNSTTNIAAAADDMAWSTTTSDAVTARSTWSSTTTASTANRDTTATAAARHGGATGQGRPLP